MFFSSFCSSTRHARSYQGYCNQRGQCITVDSQDLLNELDKILDGLSPRSAWNWIKQHWPYAFAALGGIVLLTVGLVCTRHRGRAVLTEPGGEEGRDRARDRQSEQIPLMSRRAEDPETGRTGTIERGLFGPWHHPSLSEREADKLLLSAGCTGV